MRRSVSELLVETTLSESRKAFRVEARKLRKSLRNALPERTGDSGNAIRRSTTTKHGEALASRARVLGSVNALGAQGKRSVPDSVWACSASRAPVTGHSVTAVPLMANGADLSLGMHLDSGPKSSVIIYGDRNPHDHPPRTNHPIRLTVHSMHSGCATDKTQTNRLIGARFRGVRIASNRPAGQQQASFGEQ